MSLRQDFYHLVRKDGEFDVGNSRQLVELRVLTHAQLAGRIGYDTAHHLSLPSQRGQIARRQHRSKIVSQEVIDVLSAPNDAAHREDVLVGISRAISLAPPSAFGILAFTVIDERLKFGTKRQFVPPDQMQEFVKQAKSEQVDRKPGERLIFGRRCRLGYLVLAHGLPRVIKPRLEFYRASVAQFGVDPGIVFVRHTVQS